MLVRCLNSFVITNTSDGPIGTQTAGTPLNIKVRAVDSFGNTVTSFDGGPNKVNITSNGTLSAGSGATASFNQGVLASHSVTFGSAGTNITITATRESGRLRIWHKQCLHSQCSRLYNSICNHESNQSNRDLRRCQCKLQRGSQWHIAVGAVAGEHKWRR